MSSEDCIENTAQMRIRVLCFYSTNQKIIEKTESSCTKSSETGQCKGLLTSQRLLNFDHKTGIEKALLLGQGPVKPEHGQFGSILEETGQAEYSKWK